MTKENNSEQANKRTSINKSNNSFVFISRTGKPVNRSYADKCCLVHTEYAYSVKKKKPTGFIRQPLRCTELWVDFVAGCHCPRTL